MQFRSITRIVGLLLALFSITMLAPALVAFIYRDGAGLPFVLTFFLLLAGGDCFGFQTVITGMNSKRAMAF
jgi:hypothetical protein